MIMITKGAWINWDKFERKVAWVKLQKAKLTSLSWQCTSHVLCVTYLYLLPQGTKRGMIKLHLQPSGERYCRTQQFKSWCQLAPAPSKTAKFSAIINQLMNEWIIFFLMAADSTSGEKVPPKGNSLSMKNWSVTYRCVSRGKMLRGKTFIFHLHHSEDTFIQSNLQLSWADRGLVQGPTTDNWHNW